MSLDAYKIAVKIQLTENVTRGLMAMTSHFTVANMGAKELEASMSRISKLALLGGGMMAMGGLGFKALDGLVEAAAKVETAQTKFKTLNLSTQDNALAFNTAMINSQKIMGTTIAENIGVVHDLHTVFGDLHHAVDFSEEFTRFTVMAKYINGPRAAEGLSMAGARALEHRPGLTANPEAMGEELRRMEQVYAGTRGKVSPSTFSQIAQTGKMAYALYDKEFLYGHMAAYAQSKSGSTAGTAGMTAFSSLIGGHMDGKAKGFLADLGLYQEGFSKSRQKLVHEALMKLPVEQRNAAIASLGGQTALIGGLKDDLAEKFSARPDLFIKEDLVPAIRERFGLDLTNKQIALLIGKNFNRNTGDFLGEEVLNGAQFEKDAKVWAASDSAAGVNNKFGQTYAGAMIKFNAAWENLKAVLGMNGGVLEIATKGLNVLANALKRFTEFSQNHPEITKFAIEGVALASALMIVGGSVLLFKASIGALGLLNISGIAAALGGGVGLGGELALLGTPLGLATAGIIAFCFSMKSLVKLLEIAHFKDWEKSPVVDDYKNNLNKYKNAKVEDIKLWGQSDSLVRTGSDSKDSKPTTVQLVLKDGGRVLAEVVSSVQSSKLLNAFSAGSYDNQIHQPLLSQK